MPLLPLSAADDQAVTTVAPESDSGAPAVDITDQLRARSEQVAVHNWLREVARP
jgi:hypothetical protein